MKRSIHAANIDAQLKSIGRSYPAQLVAEKPAFNLTALLGGVAAAVRHYQVTQTVVPRRAQRVLRVLQHEL